jgi:hypothetical protein
LFETINHALVMLDRKLIGREASLTAVVLDSQSVKTRRAAAHQDTTPARRSRGASAKSWSELTDAV